jgi:hypothetical protein
MNVENEMGCPKRAAYFFYRYGQVLTMFIR